LKTNLAKTIEQEHGKQTEVEGVFFREGAKGAKEKLQNFISRRGGEARRLGLNSPENPSKTKLSRDLYLLQPGKVVLV
jgi:hypothetical protein